MTSSQDIQALVINLDGATKRMTFQEKQLLKLGIGFQRLRASQVDELTDSEYERWANDWQRKLRKTEVACFLSHYRAWQKVLESHHTMLILEDDAILSDKTSELLTALTTLGSFEKKPFEHLTLETRGRKKMISQKGYEMFGGVSLHTLFLDKTGACAYLLTPKGAEKLLRRVKDNGAGLADALLCEQPNNLQSLQTVPALAIQMDMMTHHSIEIPNLMQASSSNISTSQHNKPKANSKLSNIGFKYRRIVAQVSMGITQLKHRNESYAEIGFDSEGVGYLMESANDC